MARSDPAEEPVRVATRGLAFDVRVGGPPDGVPVVLLHGFPQHSGMWSQLVPLLWTAGLRTIAPDQRGYSPGARPSDVDAYGILECMADVESIMDSLDVAQAHVIGHDFGALAAWHLASRRPERLLTLTAVSVPHPLAVAAALADGDEQRERSQYILLFRQAGKAEDLLLEDDARRLRALFGTVESESYVEPMRAPGALTGALNWYRAMSRHDLAGLGPVTVPTTYLWSDGDWSMGRRAAEACGDQVAADYRFVELPGVSHWIPDEAPAALAGAALARILHEQPN